MQLKESTPTGPSRAAWLGLAVILLLIAAAILVPAVTGWNVHSGSFAPLHSIWDPRVGPGTIPSLAIGILAACFATRAAMRTSWRSLLAGAFVLGLVWLISLATVDGLAGIGTILDSHTEYLPTARGVTDIGATLREYVSRIPLDAPHHWPVHIAGHPPGALLFFVLLVHLGVGSGVAAGFAVIVVAATTPVAVLIALHRMGAETSARRAAPFLVLGPAAIWMAVSADAVFGAVAAWGLCCLAIAATSKRATAVASWGILSGLLLGYCVMLSYGLPLLGVLAGTVLFVAGTWRPLPWAVGAAIAVVLSFAAAGFSWWEAYPVLADRYWSGIASMRPFAYWVWGDLAALAISAGPIVGASAAVAISRLPSIRRSDAGTRAVVLLTAAAIVSIVIADLSAMSKAEVERIWLPFVPWLLLGAALLPERWRRIGLAATIAFAIVAQHLLFTRW